VEYDPWRLEGIAHGTQDLIDSIEIFPDVEDAVADSVRVFAFTARRRAAKFRIIDVKQAAAELLESAEHGPVSILFGREDSGLPNDTRLRGLLPSGCGNDTGTAAAPRALVRRRSRVLCARDDDR
jgi:hypothetical protein